MQPLIAKSREIVSTLDASAFPGEPRSQAYLTWMIDTVESEPTWPVDKRVRWLGFVWGMRDFTDHTLPVSARMMSVHTPVLATPDPKHEDIIHEAIREVIDGLATVIAQKSDTRCVELIAAARSARTSAMASFCLGYLQAYSSGLDLVSVSDERNRTRPIFHRLYKQCGLVPPDTRSKS